MNFIKKYISSFIFLYRTNKSIITDMSFSILPEDGDNVKIKGETSNLFEREKTEIQEVIPNLLLVTDDIISPIKVVFDATNKLFSGENLNEKNSRDTTLEKDIQTVFEGDTKDIKLKEEKFPSPEKNSSGKHKKSELMKPCNLTSVVERRERRKSDCPAARHKGPVKLAESPGPAQSGAHSRLVHSHWSRSYITALSLVESFPNYACTSSLMP